MTERKYLFGVWEGGGNLPPQLALAQQMASQEDTQVFVLGPASLRERVESRGAQLVEVAGPAENLVASDMADVMASFTEYLTGTDAAREVLSAFDEVGPDAAIVDCMYFAALMASEKAQVSTATFMHMRYGFFVEDAVGAINEWIGPPVARVRADLGLAPFDATASIARQAWDASTTSLSMLVPDLESPVETDPRQLVHVGPIFDEPVRPREDGPPLVLVSFSTTQMGQGSVLQNVLDATAGLDARVVCTTGGVDVGDLRAPPNAEVVEWVAHSEVLPRTSAIVTHAGMGTTVAALAHGVPVVAMPMGRDQDGNAHRLAELGAGVHLAPTTPVGDIAAAIGSVLTSEEFGRSARTLAREIGQFDNGALAVSSLGWL